MRWGGALAIVAVALSAASASRAAVEVGEAVVVVSVVRGTLGSETREIAVQDDIYSQEVIETGDDAATRLVFRDGTELSMGPSSRVTIDRYIYDPDKKGAGQLAMNLLSGVFEFASGDIPSSGYDVRTPFATIAVRGTVVQFDIEDGLVRFAEGSGTVNDVQVEESNCFRGGALLDPEQCERFLGRIEAALALLEPVGLGRLQPFEGDQGDRESESGLGPFGPSGSLQ
jgi:hypothetical protein